MGFGNVPENENALGDVLVTCYLGSITGRGNFRFEWEFAGSTVSADVTTKGDVVVDARATGQNRGSAAGRLPKPLAEGDSLAFAVRDGQAYAVQNGEVVTLTVFGPEEVEEFRAGDTVADSRCELALIIAGCSLVLNRITIHRDIYHIQSWQQRTDISRAATNYPVTLGGSEWFLLGDNSLRSLDSRMFGDVQSSDFIGVARWIYWPPGRWHELQ